MILFFLLQHSEEKKATKEPLARFVSFWCEALTTTIAIGNRKYPKEAQNESLLADSIKLGRAAILLISHLAKQRTPFSRNRASSHVFNKTIAKHKKEIWEQRRPLKLTLQVKIANAEICGVCTLAQGFKKLIRAFTCRSDNNASSSPNRKL